MGKLPFLPAKVRAGMGLAGGEMACATAATPSPAPHRSGKQICAAESCPFLRGPHGVAGCGRFGRPGKIPLILGSVFASR